MLQMHFSAKAVQCCQIVPQNLGSIDVPFLDSVIFHLESVSVFVCRWILRTHTDDTHEHNVVKM